MRCFEQSLQQKSSCCFLMCCSSSSNLEKTFGSGQRGHSGDSRCLIPKQKKTFIFDFGFGQRCIYFKYMCFLLRQLGQQASLLTQFKFYNSEEHGTLRKRVAGSGVVSTVPVLGVNPLIAEIDVMLLLTVESPIGQTSECLDFFHKHHLKRTSPAFYTSRSCHSTNSLRKAITCSRKKMLPRLTAPR